MKKVFFKSKDGLRLCGIWHIPKKPTTKVIVLAHGLTVDKDEEGIFVELAELLSKNGIAVFRFDFRGHGESEGKSIDTTIKGEINDVESVIQLVKSHGYTNTGLLGASVGGGIVALYAADYQKYLRCLCFWNPSLNYDHTFLHPVTPWLRNRRAAMVEDLKNQGWTTVGSRKKVYGKQFFNEMSTIYPCRALLKISVPTIIIHGTNDKYVPYEDAKNYVKSLKNGSFITIKDGEHGFQDRQQDREIALKETLKFFLKYL